MVWVAKLAPPDGHTKFDVASDPTQLRQVVLPRLHFATIMTIVS